jgi:hypothetical protein
MSLRNSGGSQPFLILWIILLIVVFSIAFSINAFSATLYGVNTANELLRFSSASPGTVTTVGTISGLQPGENILGIDFRPATGELYALGSNGRLYIINRNTAAASFVAPLSVALNGTSFGVDFNPVPDRLRVVSNTGQNLRINVNDGVTIVDGPLNPGTPNVTAAAYTNNFNGATTTTLFVIDTNTDTLFIQNPPNNGTLVSVGPLGVNATDTNGFDIDSGENIAYAVLTVGSNTALYTINLTTGAATSLGSVGSGATSLRGLAVETGSIGGFTVFGVTTGNQLVKFNTARPNTILSTISITGLQPGENILGIDFRPVNAKLYALGSTSRLYVINTFTLNGTDFGFDFNPLPDRIRVVSNTGQNLRMNPNDGTAITDTPLNPGMPNVTAAGYTNSFAGATVTTLYVIDSTTDTLNLQGGLNGSPSPNGGTLTPVGPLGINVVAANGFDIQASTNKAFAAVQLNGETTSKLFSINLTSGAASFIGPIGTSSPLQAFAIAPGTVASGKAALDYDGDGRADLAVFRSSNNTHFVQRSSDNSVFSLQFGLASDVLTPGDFDGDGLADIAVWRPGNGNWIFLRSSNNSVQFYQFGLNGDEPIARDYDGDGKSDFAVIRRTGGQMVWYINNSSNNSFRIETFGLDSDISAPGDYDGDGRFDLGTFRNGTFFVQRSTLGFGVTQWGLAGDLVVPGDYDGDGKTDFTVMRQGTNQTWFALRSSDGTLLASNFGQNPDFAVQADYDGDGKTDIAVWRQANGVFYITRSVNLSAMGMQFGLNGDFPIARYDTH